MLSQLATVMTNRLVSLFSMNVVYNQLSSTVPQSFAIRVCAGFAQLGARGVTLTSSSGDHGVGDGNPNPATQECFTNDGRNLTKFIPTFPARYVISFSCRLRPDAAISRPLQLPIVCSTLIGNCTTR